MDREKLNSNFDINAKCEGLCRMTHKGGCAFRNIDNSRCDDYEELEEYMKQVEPNFNSHIEKGTIEMNNEYYNLMEEKMARLINENQKYKEVIDKAIDKLYCWGEALRPDFQKEMLDILKEVK